MRMDGGDMIEVEIYKEEEEERRKGGSRQRH